jgi:CheY-like chemotaxis protein
MGMSEKACIHRRILFVDDDQSFLQMMDRLMRLWSKNNWEILTASSANAALSILQEQPPNLVVIDVSMPVVDGLQFLTVVHKRYPELQKIVLTGFASEAYRSACLSNGAELFLEKPKTSEGMESIFATIDELTRWKAEPGFRGVLRRVGLLDVIQMECLGRSSSVLAVASSKTSGNIFIKEGSIIHAESGELKGEEAFYKLFALGSGDFKLNPFIEPSEFSIHSTWESLLMQAAQLRDENVETAEEVIDPSPPVPGPVLIASREESATKVITRIEEVLICSATGDVLHAWQCPNSDFRINFLEFITEKARILQNTLQSGDFDRVECEGSRDERVIVQSGPDRGVFVRTTNTVPESGPSQLRRQAPGGPPKAAQRIKAESWFRQGLQVPGLLAAGIHFSDKSGLNHTATPKYNEGIVEAARRIVGETFQVLNLQKLPAKSLRWTFENIVLEAAQWGDGTSLSMVVSRETVNLDPVSLARTIQQFVKEGEVA